MLANAFAAAVLLAAGSDGLRHTRSRTAQDDAVKVGRGRVAATYTFGAPGTADPGLKNPLSASGCFPGARMWTYEAGWFGTWKIDTVVPVAGVAGHKHSWIDGLEIDISKNEGREEVCSEALTDAPQGSTDVFLHGGQVYVDGLAAINESWKNVSMMASRYSYKQPEDWKDVEVSVREFGWHLVGSAYHSGDTFAGPQVSHLMQEEGTLNCMLTFQGTKDWKHWFSNIWAVKTDFCGFTGVHEGFKDHLMRMVTEPSWQSDIRPKLPHCANVAVTGHSLGGAMAELFTACAAHDGYQENEQMWWMDGATEHMPEKQA